MQLSVIIFLVTVATNGASVASSKCGATKKAFLDAHNEARKAVGVPDLEWDDKLAKSARAWARQCQWKHSRNVGENLAQSGPRSNDPVKLAQYHVKLWVDEKEKHDSTGSWSCMSAPGKLTCAHYTQIVWRTTKRVGCAIAHCDNIPNYSVCQYEPSGNYLGANPY